MAANDEFDYEEDDQPDRSFEGTLERILHGKKNEINVQYAAKITKVINQHYVDIEYYSNGVPEALHSVPVRHNMTSTAFFILKLKVGDKGVVNFFDDDIELYKTKGVLAESSEERVHDLNDNVFDLGFYPDSELYDFPEGDVVLGVNGGALISIDGNNISLSGAVVSLINAIIDGKNFLQHQHSNGNDGANTGPVI